MAEVVPEAQQEFWRAPVVVPPAAEVSLPSPQATTMADVCDGCGSEFIIAARYCHACGERRAVSAVVIPHRVGDSSVVAIDGLWERTVEAATTGLLWGSVAWRKFHFPAWMKYLHFPEIQRFVGLSAGSLIAFFIGLGCVAGAIGVSLFYRATNLAEFQAIQMWRTEWLLAATAAFVAGILLKKPRDKSEN